MRASAVWGSAICLLGLLTGCARDTFVDNIYNRPTDNRFGNWKIDRQIDRVTGKPISSAEMRAVRTSTSEEDNNIFIARNALMELQCFRDVPTARFVFNYYVGTEKNSTLGWRFDEKPGQEGEARILRDYRTVIIDQPGEMKTFLGQMATSRILYIRIRSLNGPRTSAEFVVEGGAEAIRSAFADCPFPEPEPEPPPRAKRKRPRAT